MTEPHDPARERALGYAYGVAAYGLWGVVAVYFKSVASVSATEVLAHRVVWSFLLLSILVLRGGAARGSELRRVVDALRTRRTLLLLFCSTVLIASNWLVFIYSVSTSRLLESSLGYFMNPLVNVILGRVFLRERLSRLKQASVALAALGVTWMAVALGGLPWISLALALSFGLYGLVRKIAPVGALTGLTTETLLLLPAALAWLSWLETHGAAAFGNVSRALDVRLALSGVVTAIPLLLFAGAARRLPLATVGFLQYLSPSLQFVLAVTVYGEPIVPAKLAAFAFIWVALALFVVAITRELRAGQAPPLRDGGVHGRPKRAQGQADGDAAIAASRDAT